MTTPVNAALAYARQTTAASPELNPGITNNSDTKNDFLGALGDAMKSIEDQGKATDKKLMDYTEGKTDVLSIVTAVNETEVALETMINVRDRMINAYQEITRMPI